MKSKAILLTIVSTLLLFSCTKKKSGVCYCKYANGNKLEFDYSTLPRSQQIDSCNLTSHNAEFYGGNCTLK